MHIELTKIEQQGEYKFDTTLKAYSIPADMSMQLGTRLSTIANEGTVGYSIEIGQEVFSLTVAATNESKAREEIQKVIDLFI